MVTTTQGNHVFFPKQKTFLFFRNHLWCFLVKNSWLFPGALPPQRHPLVPGVPGGPWQRRGFRAALGAGAGAAAGAAAAAQRGVGQSGRGAEGGRPSNAFGEVPRGSADFWGSGRCVCSRLTFANTSHSALRTRDFTLLHSTPYSTLYNHSTMYTAHSTVLHCLRSALHPPQSAPVPHSTLHGPQSTMYCNRGRIHKTVVITCFAKVSYATCIRIRGLDQAIFSS